MGSRNTWWGTFLGDKILRLSVANKALEKKKCTLQVMTRYFMCILCHVYIMMTPGYKRRKEIELSYKVNKEEHWLISTSTLDAEPSASSGYYEQWMQIFSKLGARILGVVTEKLKN